MENKEQTTPVFDVDADLCPEIAELDESEARELKRLLVKFLRSYHKKLVQMSDQMWLKEQFLTELPGISSEEAQRMAEEAVDYVTEYDRNLADLNAACDRGTTKEAWFEQKTREASAGLGVAQYGGKLLAMDQAISTANAQMARVVLTESGEISQCLNLDGFIAEQHHVGAFNQNAALEGSPFRAEIATPDGSAYGKNSFDIVIKDSRTGQIAHQYQCKYGADAKTTIELIRRGNYNNQTLLVPPEQVAEVQAAFPGKTVVAKIGGTEKVLTVFSELSKADARKMQWESQKEGELPTTDWNAYTTKSLALHLGKQAAFCGVQSALIATGFHMVSRIVQDEPIDADEAVEVALRTGADSGIKCAATGALKVASEKGVISILPKGTPIGVLGSMVCVGVEHIKTLAKVATGELTMTQALDHMGRHTVAMTYGIKTGAVGAAIGAAALSFIPLVGPIIGGVVGGTLGYMAGSKFCEAVYNGVKKVASGAKKLVKSAWEKAKDFAGGIRDRVTSWIPW